MSFLWSSPLGPAFLLTAGALLLMASGRRLPERWRQLGPSCVSGLALLAWFLLRFFATQPESYWRWEAPFGLNTALGIQLHGWSWLAGLGILLLTFIAVSLPGWQWRPGFVDARQWTLLVAVFALLVVLSATWVTLGGVWVLLMFGVGLVGGDAKAASSQAWSLGLFSTLLLLLTPLLEGGDTLATTLGVAPLSALSQLLLVLAVLIPLGVYPFHLWLTPQARRSPGRYLLVHIIPGLAVLHLLGRFDLALLSSQAWVPLSISALLGSALVAWADPDAQRAWVYVLINRATWVILVLGLTELPRPSAAVAPFLVFMLGSALWAIGRVARWHFHWNLPLWLSMAVLYGLPFTPGFVTTSMLGRLATSPRLFAGWLLILLAQTLFVAALLRIALPQPEEPGASPETAPRTRSLALVLALAAGLAVWTGLFPNSLLPWIGMAAPTPDGGLLAVFRQAGVQGWLTLLLPLILGSFLALRDERLFGGLRGWQANLARSAGLDWVYGGAGRVLHSMAVALGLLADLVDGAGQFGWVLLALLVALLLFST